MTTTRYPKRIEAGTNTRWPVLYKRTSKGGVQEWAVSAYENDDKHGVIVVTYGLKGGKKQTKSEVITVGKNIGRSNETTPYQQAQADAESRWKVNLTRKNYGLDEEAVASANKRAASPMLAKLVEAVKEVDWASAFVQPKFDGFRLVATKIDEGNIQLKSRENKPIETLVHISEQLDRVMQIGDVFDGEAYCHDMTFQDIAKAIKAVKPTTSYIKYHVYDIMARAPFSERYGRLRLRLMDSKQANLVAVETIRVASMAEVQEYQSRCLERGYEGAMLRHGDAFYEAGKRSSSLLKVKTFLDAEFEIVEILEGRGDCKGMARFICDTGLGNQKTFEVLAHGPHPHKRIYWRTRDRWLGKMLTVKFQEWTTSDPPTLRFPVALRFPDGSSALDVQ